MKANDFPSARTGDTVDGRRNLLPLVALALTRGVREAQGFRRFGPVR